MIESNEPLIIDAPIESVWKVLSEVDSWPQWMPGVRKVTGNGDHGTAKVNGVYQVTARGLPVKQGITVEGMNAPDEIVLSRKIPGMTIKLTYQLSDDPSGGTKVSRTVEARGILSGLVRAAAFRTKGKFPKQTADALEKLARVQP